MTSQEEKVNRFLRGNKKSEQPSFSLGVLGMTWYLDSFWEKLVFVLGFIALIWTLIELVFLGRL